MPPVEHSIFILQSIYNSSIVTENVLPIALRKATRICTKYLIANYISYEKLSNRRKIFTSRIDNLFVPRNVQEALDYPNRKLPIMEEINALRHNGS